MADAAALDHPPEETGYTGSYVTAQDGLRLFVREYGTRGERSLPVVCLPGLSRNGGDFHEIATALVADARQARQVVTIDSRGRGRSDYDRDAENYSFPVELSDVLSVLTAREIGRAIFLGTSRGGVLAMLLGAVRPGVIAGVILNDIGPVIEPKGLLRIRSYVGKLPVPRSLTEGADILRRIGNAQFPKFGAADWLRQARLTWKAVEGKLVPDYDPKLTATLSGLDLEQPLPPLWAQFDSLAPMPLMVVRGDNSDILSAATVDAMRARRLDIDVLDVPDQGHAPTLAEPETIARIAAFITFCEVAALGF